MTASLPAQFSDKPNDSIDLPTFVGQRLTQIEEARNLDDCSEFVLNKRKGYVIGTGGQGRVLAVPSLLDSDQKSFAVKEYHRIRRRFRDHEGPILGRLRGHPNIVKLYDNLRVNGRNFLILEYTKGTVQLNDFFRNKSLFSPRAAIEIAMTIASTLDHMYKIKDRSGAPMEIIHGDIKPENIIILPNGEIKIIDFALATTHKIRNAEDSQHQSIRGTIRYMDPYTNPIWDRVPISHASDVHALLVTLIEMLLKRKAKELMDQDFFHADPFDYNAGLQHLSNTISNQILTLWGNSYKDFANKLCRLLVTNMKFTMEMPSTRLSAEQLVRELQTLLELAPGLSFHSLINKQPIPADRSEDPTIVPETSKSDSDNDESRGHHLDSGDLPLSRSKVSPLPADQRNI